MLLTYFLNDFEMVPVAPIITGITLVFTFNMRLFLFQGLYILFIIYTLLGTVFQLKSFTLALSDDCLHVTYTMDVFLEVRIPGQSGPPLPQCSPDDRRTTVHLLSRKINVAG
jgi:hypothetical protein